MLSLSTALFTDKEEIQRENKVVIMDSSNSCFYAE
jgi:hypothetical protein